MIEKRKSTGLKIIILICLLSFNIGGRSLVVNVTRLFMLIENDFNKMFFRAGKMKEWLQISSEMAELSKSMLVIQNYG